MALLDQLTDFIAAEAAPQAAGKTGLDSGMAEKLMPVATALIMNRLGANATDPAKADQINAALDRHQGDALTGSRVAADEALIDGDKILGHIFGGRKEDAEASLASLGGIDQKQAQQMMAMAAPLVMGILGKKKQESGGFDASQLAGLLSGERDTAQAKMPNELGGVMKLLDADGDGDVREELTSMAGNLLGGLFGRK